jgi:HK97 gp10 family phage protein
MIKNLGKLDKKIDTLRKMMDDKIMAALESSAMTIRTNAVKLIQMQSPGEPYIRYKNGRSRTGVASPAGSPPNTDTGNLVKSIQVERIKDGVSVGSRESAPYGKFLEYGTSKMAERPWLRPAFNLSKKIIYVKLARAGAQVIDKVT